MLKAVIFDLDDTLLDWSGLNEDWRTIEARHLRGVFDYLCQQHPLEDVEAYIDAYMARSYEAWTAARTSLRAPNLGTLLVEAAAALGVPAERLEPRDCMEAYRWSSPPGVVIFPEVIDTLTELRDAGLRFGIVTNAFQPMWLRDAELEAFGIADYFPSCRFSAADFGYLKPHPSIFQAALDCLGTAPEETVFVGDDVDADIRGAKAAGIHAVLRVSRRRPPYLNGSVKPDSVIQSLDELPAVFDRAFPDWRP